MRLELGSRARQDLSLVLGVTGAIAVTFVTLAGVMLLYVRQRKAALRYCTRGGGALPDRQPPRRELCTPLHA